jgi:hypothetical protein
MAKYRDKKSKGCALCKPHKHGWAPKHKPKVLVRLDWMKRDVEEARNAVDVGQIVRAIGREL